MEENQEMSPELQDILNRIKAFNITNPDAVFLFGFLGWKDSEEPCEDCGGKCTCLDENKFMLGGHGDIDNLRNLSNNLRDELEDNCDKRGFVNF
jgi:hypothetical protein